MDSLQIPPGLKETGAEFWRRFMAEKDVSEVQDVSDLERYCRLLDEEKELEARVATEGMLFRDRWGKPRPHPACKLLTDVRTLIMRQAREMGLNVVSEESRIPRLPF
jgi:phage terminase small subunit